MTNGVIIDAESGLPLIAVVGYHPNECTNTYTHARALTYACIQTHFPSLSHTHTQMHARAHARAPVKIFISDTSKASSLSLSISLHLSLSSHLCVLRWRQESSCGKIKHMSLIIPTLFIIICNLWPLATLKETYRSHGDSQAVSPVSVRGNHPRSPSMFRA